MIWPLYDIRSVPYGFIRRRFSSGLPLTTRRSAMKPGRIRPRRSSRPSTLAPFDVACFSTSSGWNPASWCSSSSRLMPNPYNDPYRNPASSPVVTMPPFSANSRTRGHPDLIVLPPLHFLVLGPADPERAVARHARLVVLLERRMQVVPVPREVLRADQVARRLVGGHRRAPRHALRDHVVEQLRQLRVVEVRLRVQLAGAAEPVNLVARSSSPAESPGCRRARRQRHRRSARCN